MARLEFRLLKSFTSLNVQSLRASSTSAKPTTSLVRNQSSVSTLLDDDMVALDNTGLSQAELNSARSYSEVPGPRPYPLFGNTWRLLPYIGQYQISNLADVSAQLYQEYGKIVRLGGLVGRPDLLFVYDADEIEKVYRQEGPTPFRPSMPCLVHYKSVVRKEFFGRLAGVVGVHGEPWREFRTKVQKPILQLRTVKKYIEPIENVTDYFIQRMNEMKDKNSEMPADFDNEIHKWSLECIGRVALDVRLGCLNPDLSNNSEPQKIIDAAKYALRNVAILELKLPFWRYIPTNLWRKYVSNMDFFIEVCMKYIDSAMERLKTKTNLNEHDMSLVERILLNEPDPKTAYVLALDLILVGIDTISMAVCSMLYQLATRPEEQEKLHQELLRIMPDPSEPLTADKLDQMVYLKAFIKEVFRKYSTVIGNGRTLQNDMVICGYRIPKGIQLVFPTIVTGNMPEYVTDPETFYPERWIKQSSTSSPSQCPAHSHEIHPFASLPYGHGARMCLGRRFADLEMQILLSKLIRSYRLEFNHKPLEYKVTFMYAPDGDLKFKMTPRS
uniref:Probable cytochrome P450 301a1, mitochondrial n=1 Tax=Cacopsylla melanoneura TaxID=428564 RepID=A0A8D8LHC6_9HEMI